MSKGRRSNDHRRHRGEAVIDLLTNPEGVRAGSPPDWLPFAFRVGAGVSVWNKFRGVYRLHGEAAARLFRHTGALRLIDEDPEEQVSNAKLREY